MDWLHKGGSYFQATLGTDVWHISSGDQTVRFWREPLSALCSAATDAGFLIEELIEPVPAETMRERYPEDYEKLSKESGFLILRLLYCLYSRHRSVESRLNVPNPINMRGRVPTTLRPDDRGIGYVSLTINA